MTKIYMVRHGEAASHWSENRNPGLSAKGKTQVEAAVEKYADVGPITLLTSPLLRTRETAQAFERRWQVHAAVEPAITEIPTPDIAFDQRSPWLGKIMTGDWHEYANEAVKGGTLGEWRERLIGRLASLREDTLMSTHFIAINAAVGWALGKDTIVTFKPDNASCTVLEVVDGELRLVSLGDEAQTTVG